MWPRGKGLGGSSLLNFMQYMRGNPKDYDEWRDLGADGWSYKDVLPFFKKSQRLHESGEVNARFHGTEGPMGVLTLTNASCPMSSIIEEAYIEKLGLKMGDCNAEDQNVIYRSQFNQNSGRRADSYTCFASPYVGRGLTVLTYAHATELIIEKSDVKGVQVERFGETFEFYAKNEVVLSAGAIGSPQIMLLSGIGPKEHLDDIGIKTVLDRPGVGSNLQDHIMVTSGGLDRTENTERLGFDPFFAVRPTNYWTWFTQNPFNGPLGNNCF